MTQQEFQTRYKYNPSTDCIGEGGFGKVYKAYDTHLDRWVAIKVAEVKHGQENVRLKREVEMVSKLPTHPNIANYEACYTFSSIAGDYDFAVLQYYEEGNLQQLMDSGKLNLAQKETLLRQILEGIGFLHNQEIIHRDLKPQNILIAKRNDEYIPKITDFGISKKLDFNNSSEFTNSLAGAGTMAYASPEQLLGKTIKKNTDLWSFGVIAFQLLTDKLPFNTGKETVTSEAGRLELFKQITNGVISDNLSSISVTWKNIILNCLVVDNNHRMQNVSKYRNATENLIEPETNTYTHKADNYNNTTRIDNRKTTTIEYNNPSNYNGTIFKVIISVIALFIVIVVSFKYFNKNSDNVAIQPVNENSVVDTFAVVDTVAVDTSTNFNSNSTNKEIIYSSMTDIDGNVYKTVKIGNQIWMAENLRVTRLNDGTEIPNVSENNEWLTLDSPGYCWFNNDYYTYSKLYGALYNLYAVCTEKLAPKGWRVANSDDWNMLVNNLGGQEKCWEKLTNNASWFTKKTINKINDLNDKTGFSAIPCGERDNDSSSSNKPGDFVNYGYVAWWVNDIFQEYGTTMELTESTHWTYYDHWEFNTEGHYVRCVKNN